MLLTCTGDVILLTKDSLKQFLRTLVQKLNTDKIFYKSV